MEASGNVGKLIPECTASFPRRHDDIQAGSRVPTFQNYLLPPSLLQMSASALMEASGNAGKLIPECTASFPRRHDDIQAGSRVPTFRNYLVPPSLLQMSASSLMEASVNASKLVPDCTASFPRRQ